MKIAVLGAKGSIGSRHVSNIKKLGHEPIEYDNPDFDLSHPVDERRDAVIAVADAVVIATPSNCHYRDLLDSMAAGKPTFVEKPIATNERQWRDLQNYLSTKEVFVGCNLRLHPCVQQAKQWIAGGHIGRPLWANFICATKTEKKPYLGDGVILNTGSHEVDLAIHFLGPVSHVESASTTSEYCEGAGDDIADFVLQHESGARSSFHLDFVTPNEIREFWIAGDEKNIGVDLPGRRSSLGDFVSTAPGDYGTDYENEMRAFVSRIEGKIAPGASGEDGLATLRVLLDVRKKAGLDLVYEHREIKGWGGQ